MKTVLSALAIAAALGFAAAPAIAQQTTNASGTVVDGMGSGSNMQNRYVFDGPANADVTSLTTAVGKFHSGSRVNRLSCDLVGSVICNDAGGKAPSSFIQ